MKIQDLRAREIIDCKGKPLLEVDIITEDGTMGRAASPSGISAGEHEAMVLRDGDQKHACKDQQDGEDFHPSEVVHAPHHRHG